MAANREMTKTCVYCDSEFEVPRDACRCMESHTDVAGPSTQHDKRVGSKRKHEEFRNVDLWTPPLTEYFLKIIKEFFPLLNGKGLARTTVWRDICKKMQLMMPHVTEDQLKNKLENLKQVFHTYRDAVSKTGNPKVKEPPHLYLLFTLYGQRPLDRPQTVSCGLPPEGAGAATPDGNLSAEEDVEEPVRLPQQPAAPRALLKRRRVRLPTHSERMHYSILENLQAYQKKSLKNQRNLLKCYKQSQQMYLKAQEERDALLRSIFNTAGSQNDTNLPSDE
ncbi:hypothetical protein Pmani_012804 [Petrolisthes manimaculis]|uniref:Myb/SANT-like DNA-binding domain-containing protein n=1 Tax=Petrolisthes manimaculis TaxID=1843537 RepID=A0AAE1PYM3_9EUCA|nr:hypothetical protein Pmani_012804 [Petrolisthes manimaculis]